MGRRAKPAKGKAEAKQPLVRKSPNDDVGKVRDLETRLEEALEQLRRRDTELIESLEQQTATGEILRVISSSPTDIHPVFDTIVTSANRLCGGLFSALIRYDGELMHFVAHTNFNPEALEVAQRAFPRPPTPDVAAGRAILERAVVHLPDVTQAPVQIFQRSLGYRSVLAVPMLTDGRPVGAIAVTREEPWPFADAHIALLKTFADQAVIAIENVRLFKELQTRNSELSDALEQQTATSEVLRVISSSPTDVQPVFDAIARNAVTLCGGIRALVLRFDGVMLHVASHHNIAPDGVEQVGQAFPRRPGRDYPPDRAFLDQIVVHVPDLQAATEFAASTARRRGVGSLLAVPLLREREAFGVISLARELVGPFSPQQIEVLQTFADQAVIAIENVRLFKELQGRTSELTRSVEELRALGEVGQAVSSTLDLETVLDTIVARAAQLSVADAGTIYEYDEAAEEFHVRATHTFEEELGDARRATHLRKGEGAVGLAAKTGQPVQIPDIREEGAYDSSVRDVLLRLGYRALLAVPLVHEDRIIGGLVVNRKVPGEFSLEVVNLLKTFATQSALAIQNARLFREIEQKSRQLERASQHKSEFLANMSHELRTPLNAIIGFAEVLTERMFGELNEKQDEYLRDIYASGQHLLSLINDILDLSKIEAGRMELEPADFDLPSAVDNALTLVRERAGRRGIALGRAIDERVGTIRADERKVKQVLLNLLSNALKFTPEGGRIDVRAAVSDGMAEVSVADTGVGIAPEDQEAVFEEFRQVGTADKKVEGTGLGLALSRKFIELHGGRIWVKSQVGTGATFTFTLPVRRGE
jgi:signal transduction histidine kinase